MPTVYDLVNNLPSGLLSTVSAFPGRGGFDVTSISQWRYFNDKSNNNQASPQLELALKALGDAYRAADRIINAEALEPARMAKATAERNRIAGTGVVFVVSQAQADLIDALLGQMSDGKWENTPSYEKYWRNIELEGSKVIVDVQRILGGLWGAEREQHEVWFADSSSIKRWLAKKAQLVLNEEIRDYYPGMSVQKLANETSKYMDRGVNQTFGQVQAAINSLKL